LACSSTRLIATKAIVSKKKWSAVLLRDPYAYLGEKPNLITFDQFNKESSSN
jgi:hypothetical protein